MHGTIGLAQHQDSVREQLDWLFNTRVPWPADTLEARTRDGVRSTIDYGIADLSLYPVENPGAMARLTRHLEEAIARFEPRIVAPKVVLERGERRDGMIVLLSGALHVDGQQHPLALRIPIQIEQGSAHAR